jgi:hypothetical protein
LIVTGSFLSSAIWITRFPCPDFKHSQFMLRGATVLWRRGRAPATRFALAETSKKRQFSGISEGRVLLTDLPGLPRMRQCQKPRCPARD